MDERRLEGGFDGGATVVDGTVRRVAGPWAPSVRKVLAHLLDRGFDGAPRPLGAGELGRDVVSYLPGETVGSCRPWPAWTHSDKALAQVAGWQRRFHEAVLDFDPGIEAVWREGGICSGVGDWPQRRRAVQRCLGRRWPGGVRGLGHVRAAGAGVRLGVGGVLVGSATCPGRG